MVAVAARWDGCCCEEQERLGCLTVCANWVASQDRKCMKASADTISGVLDSVSSMTCKIQFDKDQFGMLRHRDRV